MTSVPGRWDDLFTRLLSGATLAATGLGAVWLGGFLFHVFVAVVCAVMIWELSCMLGARDSAILRGAVAGLVLLVAGELPEGFALPLVLAPGLLGIGSLARGRSVYMLYGSGILIAGYGLMVLRDDFGFLWMAWVAFVVVATDVGGYFAGRLLGGPKIFPRLSPKKTWSGTVAGWFGAALVSIPFVLEEAAGWELLGIGIAVSMASQMGDVMESGIKRRSGVKDSSSLLPGHGGLLDRFDSMLGASLLILIVARIAEFPPVAGG